MHPLTRIPSPAIDTRIAKHASNRLRAGGEFPNVILTRYNAHGLRENYSTEGELEARRVVIFTVPGAFTTTCTQQLQGFAQHVEKILSLKIMDIICIVPDNIDVAEAWNKMYGHRSIKMWADNLGELTDKIGFGLNLSGDRGLAMGLIRSAMVVIDGKVEMIEIEKSAGECRLSHVDNILKYLIAYEPAD